MFFWGSRAKLHLAWIDKRTFRTEEKLDRLNKRIDIAMATLAETLEAVRASNTKSDSLIELFKGVQKQLADVLSGANLPPHVQQEVDAIFAEAKSQADEIDTAIGENTEGDGTDGDEDDEGDET